MTIEEKVLARIKEVGYVDNYWAIDNRITTRLAAVINKLEQTRPPLLHLPGREVIGMHEKNFIYAKHTHVTRVGDKYKLI